MKIRLSTIASLGLAIVAGLMLFQTSQNVQQAEDKLNRTREAMAKEQDSVRVLETEWDYLNRPDRIEDLARQYLKMGPTTPDALVRNSDVVTNPPKPVTKIVPATLKVVPPAVTTTAPMPAQTTNTGHRQFDDLLNSLAPENTTTGKGKE